MSHDVLVLLLAAAAATAIVLGPLYLIFVYDVTAEEVKWGPHTLLSTRNGFRHRLCVDGVRVADVPASETVQAVVQDPLLGAVTVAAHPVSGGATFFVGDQWVGGKRPNGLQGEAAPFPDSDDPRWLAAQAALSTALRHPSLEVRGCALSLQASLFEAVRALADVRARHHTLEGSSHPSVPEGLASLEETAATWDAAIQRLLGLAHELHGMVVASRDTDTLPDLAARVKAEREVRQVGALRAAQGQRQ